MPEFNLREARRAVHKSRLQPNERLLVLSVLDFWSRKRPMPFPGVAKLMRWTGFCRQTVLNTIERLFAKGVFPDTRPRDGNGQLVKTTKPLKFDVSELVYRLDQPLVYELDQPRKTHWSIPSTPLVYSLDGTGLSGPKAKRQNGSRSSQVSKEVSSEVSNAAEAKNAPAISGGGSSTSKGSRTPEQKRAHQEVVAHYVQAFERERGRKPVFKDAEGKATYDLLTKLAWDATEAKRRIDLGLSSWQSATIRTIASDPDRIAGQPRVRKVAGPRQPNSGYRPPVSS